MKTAAIYAQVSTPDQCVENQLYRTGRPVAMSSEACRPPLFPRAEFQRGPDSGLRRRGRPIARTGFCECRFPPMAGHPPITRLLAPASQPSP